MTPVHADNPLSVAARGLASVLLAVGLLSASVSVASAATFDPTNVISNDNMRDYTSMSANDVQAFLETQSGALATLKTSDYDKKITLSKKKNNTNSTPDKGEKPKLASRIIWEACQAWKINPRVMLALLQKEQSLITNKPKPGSTTLARAVGAGCPGHLIFKKSVNPVATNKYPGFGNQVWHGARLLSSYGEGNASYPTFTPGMKKDIYNPHTTGSWLSKKTVSSKDASGTVTKKTTYYIAIKNLATFKLYVYNPSVGAKSPFGDLSSQSGSCTGNASYWLIYRRFFGSTFADPKMRPVYRFRRASGDYLYTTSPAERYHLASAAHTPWKLDGAAFSVDSSATTGTVPLYRFYNRKTGRHSFVTSHATYLSRRTTAGKKTWTYNGVAFRVATHSSKGAATVWGLKNIKTGVWYFTSSSSAVKKFRTSSYHESGWRYRGIAWYLPRL
jgi:hypothetical protein